MAVKVVISEKNTEQWFTAICHISLLSRVLTNIRDNSSNTVNPEDNKYHYSLTQYYEHVDLDFITARIGYIPWTGVEARPTEMLCLGVSRVSFKACVYVEKERHTLSSSANAKTISVVFWFNSLSDAYKAMLELDFGAYSVSTVIKTRDMRHRIQVGMMGEITNSVITTTREAIMQGQPDGYIIQDSSCNQKLFDLACKQPKSL